MLKKFSEAQKLNYNYMLFIEIGTLSSEDDISSLQVKAVTIEGYFETIKQIYDYIESMEFISTEKIDNKWECEISNIYDVSRKIYFIKNEGVTFNEVDDTDIVDRIVNRGPNKLVNKRKEYLEARV